MAEAFGGRVKLLYQPVLWPLLYDYFWARLVRDVVEQPTKIDGWGIEDNHLKVAELFIVVEPAHGDHRSVCAFTVKDASLQLGRRAAQESKAAEANWEIQTGRLVVFKDNDGSVHRGSIEHLFVYMPARHISNYFKAAKDQSLVLAAVYVGAKNTMRLVVRRM